MARKFRSGYDFRSAESLSQRDAAEETGDPCACGIRCAERDHEGNAKRCPRPFCDTDTKRVADVIRDMPETYARLRAQLGRTGAAEERVSGSREAPVPLDLQTEAFMREIVHVTCSWEDQVRAVARLSDLPDGPRRDAVALAQACRTLHAHLNTLLALSAEDKLRHVPLKDVTEAITEGCTVTWDTAGEAWAYRLLGGKDAGLEFLALHSRAGGMLGLGRERRRVTEVPCDGCGARTLVQWGAKGGGLEPRISCTACSVSYAGASYDLLLGRVYQAQMKALNDRKAS
jgi:hypothetical protein